MGGGRRRQRHQKGGNKGKRRQGRAGVPACRRAKSAARGATEPSGECVVCGVSYACPDACIRDARVRRCASPDSASMRGPAPLVRARGGWGARAGGQASSSTREPLTHYSIPDQQDGSKINEGTASARSDRCWRTWLLSSISKSIFISFPIISLVFSTCQTQSCLLNIVDVPRALRECRLDE